MSGAERATRAPEGAGGPAPISDVRTRRRRVLTRLGRRNLARLAAVGAIVAVVALWGYSWVSHRLAHVTEEDARIAADMVAVASRFEGWIAALPAEQGAVVKKGDVLVEIDTRPAKLKLAELVAQVNETRAERQTLAAELKMTEAQTDYRLQAQRHRVEASRAAVQAARARYDFVRSEHARIESLASTRVVSAQALEKAAADFKDASEKRAQTAAELAVAEAQLLEAEAARQQAEVLKRKIEQLEAEEARLNAVQDQQRLEIEDRILKAPIDGVVDKLFVNPGEFVRQGQRLLLVHDPNSVWIDANVRETDVRKFEVGAPVAVSIDAYPDRTFQGRVVHIGSSATSQYALLPTPNPSGNFTKIVQRLPVKIKVEEASHLLRPGMMVEIDIAVSAR